MTRAPSRDPGTAPDDPWQGSLFDDAGLAVDRGARADADRAVVDAAAVLLADGFGAQILRFSVEQGAQPPIAQQAARLAVELSIATSAGHTCLPLGLSHAAASDGSERSSLLSSGVVDRHGDAAVAPMVLDDQGRLYLRRYYEYERRLATDLVSRAADRARLTLITGGPGTGKTTTVVAILARWLACQPDLRVALAAPTGKAAARMLASVRDRAAALPAGLRERLPAQAGTLHRLLGSLGAGGRFRHDAERRLPIDGLIVDESSMLDVALAARLIDALPASAQLVLLGDADQLSAVEAGAVFAELVGHDDGGPSPLADCVVRLTHSHRFGAASAIGRLAAAINRGRADDAWALLQRHPEAPSGPTDEKAPSGIGWIDDSADDLSDAVRCAIVDGFVHYREALTACLQAGTVEAAARSAVFAAFDRFRVLAATRRGRRGVDAVNRLMERAVRDWGHTLAAQDERSPWYAGRPVLIERNDAVLRLFNGDVGLCLPGDAGRLYVWFAADDGSLRAVAPPRLPAHSSAFAMTIHKSQGSEFDEVLTLLARPDSPLNHREAVYTAVTRARRRVTLAGDPAAFAQACRSPIVRDGGLRQRLRDALRSPELPGSR